MRTRQRKVIHANQALGIVEKGKYHKLRNGIKTFGIMSTWSLENAVTTADSMRARGYGAGRRTSFTVYRLDGRDGRTITIILLFFMIILSGFLTKTVECKFYPRFQIKELEGLRQSQFWESGNVFAAAVYIAYLLLCFMPLIINIREDRKWRRLQSKI